MQWPAGVCPVGGEAPSSGGGLARAPEPPAKLMELAGKKILLGVCGSIAAYKAVVLLRLLQKSGAEVRVAMTQAATRFVSPLTFGTLAQTPAYVDVWDPAEPWSQHVKLGNWADLMVIAPATAHTLAKLAHGLCDDAVTAVALSAACPLLVAPAMDREMMVHPATRANLDVLAARGVHIAEAEAGYLASGLEGAGRLMEPEQLHARIVAQLSGGPEPPPTGPLVGRRVLISAGPTREAIDPVRYLSNHSTGKMGIALAEAAARLGAEVTLVLGPTELRPQLAPAHLKRLRLLHIETALELEGSMLEHLAAHDMVLMAAAVADYRPREQAPQKLKKKPGRSAKLALELVENPDILAGLVRRRRKGQLIVGFALETENGLANARAKLQRKGADLIVLNTLTPETGFGTDTNAVTLVPREGAEHVLPLAPKAQIAEGILHYLAALPAR